MKWFNDSALTEGEVSGMVGHNKEYWQIHNRKALEIFANMSAIDILELPEGCELSGMLKELFEAYQETVS